MKIEGNVDQIVKRKGYYVIWIRKIFWDIVITSRNVFYRPSMGYFSIRGIKKNIS